MLLSFYFTFGILIKCLYSEFRVFHILYLFTCGFNKWLFCFLRCFFTELKIYRNLFNLSTLLIFVLIFEIFFFFAKRSSVIKFSLSILLIIIFPASRIFIKWIMFFSNKSTILFGVKDVLQLESLSILIIGFFRIFFKAWVFILIGKTFNSFTVLFRIKIALLIEFLNYYL